MYFIRDIVAYTAPRAEDVERTQGGAFRHFGVKFGRAAPNAPTMLDGTNVTIGGQSAFIDVISPGQIKALVLSGVPTGARQITVTTAEGASAAAPKPQLGTGPILTPDF